MCVCASGVTPQAYFPDLFRNLFLLEISEKEMEHSSHQRTHIQSCIHMCTYPHTQKHIYMCTHKYMCIYTQNQSTDQCGSSRAESWVPHPGAHQTKTRAFSAAHMPSLDTSSHTSDFLYRELSLLMEQVDRTAELFSRPNASSRTRHCSVCGYLEVSTLLACFSLL